MLEIEYLTDPDESAKAAIDFLSTRPIMSALFTGMKACCIVYGLGFGISVLNRSLRVQDYVVGSLVVAWFFHYRYFSRWIIKRRLLAKKFAQVKCLYKIDEKSILYKLHNLEAQHIEWKKLKYILRNDQGYILPLTGLGNAGKFLWIPQRSLPANGEFPGLLQKLQIRIKTLNL